MKTNPVDGGRYRKAVKFVKRAVKTVAREVELEYGLPKGSVRVSITKLSPKHRAKLAARDAS